MLLGKEKEKYYEKHNNDEKNEYATLNSIR